MEYFKTPQLDKNDAPVVLPDSDAAFLPSWMPLSLANGWLLKYWETYQRVKNKWYKHPTTGQWRQEDKGRSGWSEERYEELVMNMLKAWGVWKE